MKPLAPLRRQLAATAESLGLRRWINWHLNYHRRLHLNGVTMREPKIQGLACPDSEPWMLELLRRVLPLKPGRFLDVGVNLGQTLLKVKALEPARDYLGFEPNPVCLHYLAALIRDNGFSGVQLVPAGLFEHDQVLSLGFFSDDPADASASMIENFRPNAVKARTLVPVFRYETVEQAVSVQTLGVVKIDVEGAELEVLRGLLPALRRDRPLVLLEVLPAYSTDNRPRVERQQALAALLHEAGYGIQRVRKTADGHFHGLQPLADFGVHGDLEQCDYLILPAEVEAPA